MEVVQIFKGEACNFCDFVAYLKSFLNYRKKNLLENFYMTIQLFTIIVLLPVYLHMIIFKALV